MFCWQITLQMFNLRKRLTLAYINTPFFYKLYALTSGITYLYFPETQNIILINTGSLLLSSFIDTVDQYVKFYYPDKLLLCDITYFSNIAFKIGSLGYVSNNLNTLKTMHGTMIGIGYQINSYLLSTIINGARSSAIWGFITSVAVKCGILTFNHCVKNSISQLIQQIKYEFNDMTTKFIERLNTETELRSIVSTINSALQSPNEYIRSFINTLENQSIRIGNVFLEDELDKIAPKRCPAFNNKYHDDNAQCSCCMEENINKRFHRVLPCNHVFCVECIDRWLLEKTTVCPNCRRDLYPVYLDMIKT